MASAGKKWLIGCGIGCGLLVVIAGGIGTCGYMAAKKIADSAEDLDEGFEVLEEVYGKVTDYRPEADGAIPADRLETFLAVREQVQPVGSDLADMLLTLDGEKSGGIFAKFKAGANFVPRLLEFIKARNQALADNAMGLGEYSYIYSVTYYGWLEYDIADGPNFKINDENDDDSGVQWGFDDDDDVRGEREADLRRAVHDMQREMLGNQIGDADRGGLDPAWVATLRAEAQAMDDRRRRLLWESGLPEPLRTSLEPFRGRLEESYVPVLNAIEMGLIERN